MRALMDTVLYQSDTANRGALYCPACGQLLDRPFSCGSQDATGARKKPADGFHGGRECYPMYRDISRIVEVERMKVAVYCRVSSEEQKQKQTINTQIDFATRYAQLRDRFGTLWMIVHERPMP